MSEETVTIRQSQYNEIVEAYIFLNCLRAAGVDNWEGYDHAVEMMEEDEQ